MDLVKNLLVLLHLVGMAAIVGSWLVVLRAPRVVPAMLWGARAQLVTGLLLVGIDEAGTEPVNHAKIGVKLVIALAVVACAEIANAAQKRGAGRPQLVQAAGGLALLNAAIAVLWTSAS